MGATSPTIYDTIILIKEMCCTNGTVYLLHLESMHINYVNVYNIIVSRKRSMLLKVEHENLS